ncbi:MAG: hypothetical protein WBP41_06710, partial [Saprospiraceae bacterium]
MRIIGIVVFVLFSAYCGLAQRQTSLQPIIRKGNIFIYWGWNRAWYSSSDMHFKSENFDFTLQDVKAHDKPSTDINNYINPFNAT